MRSRILRTIPPPSSTRAPSVLLFYLSQLSPSLIEFRSFLRIPLAFPRWSIDRSRSFSFVCESKTHMFGWLCKILFYLKKQ